MLRGHRPSRGEALARRSGSRWRDAPDGSGGSIAPAGFPSRFEVLRGLAASGIFPSMAIPRGAWRGRSAERVPLEARQVGKVGRLTQLVRDGLAIQESI